MLASLLLAACTPEPPPTERATTPVVTDDWRERLTSSSDIAVVTLFVTGLVMGIDPVTLEIAPIADLKPTQGTPTVTALSGHRMLMVDSAPGHFGILDTETGRVRWDPRPTEIGFGAAGASIGPEGLGYVTANYAAPNTEGVLFKVDLDTLEIVEELPLPYGQKADVVFDADGRYWAVADAGPAAQRGVTVSPQGAVTPFAIRGRPMDLAMSPWGHAMVTLYDRDSIIEVDEGGRTLRTLHGFESFPGGIAVGSRGKGVVVAEGVPGKPGAVYFVDLRKMRILDRFPVHDCQAPREAVVIGERAVIACVGPPSVIIVDVKRHRQVGFISLEEWAVEDPALLAGDEPRGLSVLSPEGPN